MSGVLFSLTSFETGRPIAFGLIAPAARYCSVLNLTQPQRLTRRFLTPRQWRGVESELRDHLPPGPLPADSVLRAALGALSNVVVQYVTGLDLDVAPAAVTSELDRWLRGMSGGARFSHDGFATC